MSWRDFVLPTRRAGQTPPLGSTAAVSRWDCESLFGAWSRLMTKRPQEMATVSAMIYPMPVKTSLLRPVRTDQPWEVRPRLARLCETLEVSTRDVLDALGLQLGDGITVQEGGGTFLRYCQSCMQFGYHSMLFQHAAIDRCPMHGTRLLSACPSCGSSMRPTFWSATHSPFSCECGHLLMRTTQLAPQRVYIETVDAMLSDRARDINVRAPDGRSSILPRQLPVRTLGKGMIGARQAARATAWPLIGGRKWPTFPEAHAEQLRCGLGDAAAHTRLAYREAADVMALVVMWVGDEVRKDLHRMIPKIGWTPEGLRWDGTARLLAVAVHKLACVYRVGPLLRAALGLDSPEDAMNALLASGAHVQFSDRPVDSMLNASVYRSELWGFFGAVVVESRLTRTLESVSWTSLPATHFWTCWRIQVFDAGDRCRYRARVSEKQVRRLINRYAWRNLWMRDQMPGIEEGG